MKLTILSTIAAIGLLSAGAAVAQGHPPSRGDHRPEQSGPQQRGPQHPGPGAKPSHNEWERPQARKGDRWNRHVRACKAKYRSYSPQRDAFRSNRGDWVRCRL